MLQSSFQGSVHNPVTQPTDINVQHFPTATGKYHIQHFYLSERVDEFLTESVRHTLGLTSSQTFDIFSFTYTVYDTKYTTFKPEINTTFFRSTSRNQERVFRRYSSPFQILLLICAFY